MSFKKNLAFTLLELVIVVVIIGVLAGIGITQYQKIIWRSRYAELLTTVGVIERAKETYKLQHGDYGQAAAYPKSDTYAGNGTAAYNHTVENDLGITIPLSGRFFYAIYPNVGQNLNRVYWGIPGEGCGDGISWSYDYVTKTWIKYNLAPTCPSRDNFVPPN